MVSTCASGLFSRLVYRLLVIFWSCWGVGTTVSEKRNSVRHTVCVCNPYTLCFVPDSWYCFAAGLVYCTALFSHGFSTVALHTLTALRVSRRFMGFKILIISHCHPFFLYPILWKPRNTEQGGGGPGHDDSHAKDKVSQPSYRPLCFVLFLFLSKQTESALHICGALLCLLHHTLMRHVDHTGMY